MAPGTRSWPKCLAKQGQKIEKGQRIEERQTEEQSENEGGKDTGVQI